MNQRAIIIDCDPGIDDAVSLLLAMSAPAELEILGITTVAGNVPVETAANNACFIRDLADQPQIPVYIGCARPLRQPLHTAEAIHGETGLGPIKSAKSLHPPQPMHAVDFTEQTLTAAPDNSVTLVLNGPMTNLATLIERTPSVVQKIEEIIVMGGALREAGNFTPSAEFNVYADPHAADIVFRCGRPIVVHSLDATHQVALSTERRNRFANLNGNAASIVLEMLDFFNNAGFDRHKDGGMPLHDPCTIAYLLNADLFRGSVCNLTVEIESELTMGHTAVDYWHVTERVPNVNWIHTVDADGFFDLLIERLCQFN